MNATTTDPRRLVTAVLLRAHRPSALLFWGVMLTGVTAAVVVNEVLTSRWHLDDDPWLLLAGTAGKYWMLVMGVSLVAVNLRTFVANGITRRTFVAGAAGFGLLAVVGFALVLMVGTLVEQPVLRLTDPGAPTVSSGYAGTALAHHLPMLLAYLISGVLMGAGFYRFGSRIGAALLIPAVVPLVLTETLIGSDVPAGDVPPAVPYPAALAICLAVMAVGLIGARRLLADVAIRRTAG